MDRDHRDPMHNSWLAPAYENIAFSPQMDVPPITTTSPPQGSALRMTEHIAFRDPIQFQQALESLQQYPKSFIRAWLLMAKSLGLSAQIVRDHYQQASHLSIDQVYAIAILQDLPYDQVFAWYGKDTTHGVGQCAWKVDCNDCCRDTGPTTGRLSTCSTVWTKRSSSRRSSKSSYSSLGASSATREEEKRVSKRLQTNPLGDLVEAPEIKTSPHNGAVSDHHAEKSCTTYRCTGCSRTFKSMQTWSRHEKEDHEDISFPCMPNGAIDVTARGRTCALCGQEPTEEHLRSHNIERCTQVRHVFKRSDQLKQHLETHGLKRRSRQSDLLVNKWQCVPDKRAWACGFCKSLFASLVDFHKHVAAQHYERGESRDWDHTKVILGLLSQPHIAGPWERLLAFRFRVQSLSCKWSKSKSGCLQTRLELGQEPGEVLAEAALECGIYDRDLLHEVFRIQEPFTPDLFGIAAPMVSGPPVPPKPLSSAPSSCSGGDFQSRAGHPMVDNKPFLELDLFPTTSPSFFDMSSYAWQVNMSNFEHPERRDPNHQYDINSDDNSGLIHPMDLNINQGLGFSSDAVVNDCH